MPRKSKSTATKTASKGQSKKQVQRQSTEFGELDTTPTSHHDGSPVPSTEPKSHSNGDRPHNDDEIIDQDEFDDDIDDSDLAELADTQDNPNTPSDRKIAWSERGSGTHRSSSMSSQEEEQSGHVFGYIGEVPALSSPASGHDALPDTLPLPTIDGAMTLPGGQTWPSLLVDFSETASTIFRSSPFGKSHVSRKSGTASRPNSVHENVECGHNNTQPQEGEVSGDDIPQTLGNNKDVSKAESLIQDAANSESVEGHLNPVSDFGSLYKSNIEPEGGHTSCELASQNISLNNPSGQLDDVCKEREFKAATTPDDVRCTKKRKQWPKTPLQFDEDTQEVKLASQLLPHIHIDGRPITGHKMNSKNLTKKEGKKRKSKASGNDKPRKKSKPAARDYEQALVIDDASMLDNDHEMQSHGDEKEISRPILDINRGPSKAECEDKNENITVETIPESSLTSHTPEVGSNDEPAEKSGDCIFVAQDEMPSGGDYEIHVDGLEDSATPDDLDENRPSMDTEADAELHSAVDDSGKDESHNEEGDINLSSSEVVRVETPQLPGAPQSTAKSAPGRRVGRNFSVSEKGSPIPWRQEHTRMDLPSTTSPNITVLSDHIPGVHYETHTTQTSGRSFKAKCKHLNRDHKRPSAKQQPDPMKIPFLAQEDLNIRLRPSLLTELQREQWGRREINKSQNTVSDASAADNSRKKIHDLVDVSSVVESCNISVCSRSDCSQLSMACLSSKSAEIMTVADAYRNAGSHCVEKIQSRFMRERSVVIDDASDHTRKFQHLLSKSVKFVDKSSKKRSDSLNELKEVLLGQTSLYEDTASALQALYGQLMSGNKAEGWHESRS